MPILKTALKALIYGQEGVGKTLEAAKWPGAIFIDFEGSTETYDVERLPNKNPYFPPKSWPELLQIINNLTKGETVNFQKTLVIDPLDACVPLIVENICSKNPGKKGEIYNDLTDFGWDNGYTKFSDEITKLLSALEELRLKKQWNIVIVCHGTVRRLELPEEDTSFERWEPNLFRRPKQVNSAYDLVKGWAAMILFLAFKTILVTDQNTGKTKATGEQRVMRTTHSATWDGKNRHDLPEEIPLVKDRFALAHLFRDTTQKATPAAKPAPVPAEQPVPQAPAQATPTPAPVEPTPAIPTGVVTQATLEKLKQLMNSGWPEVRDKDIMKAVHKAGHFPVDKPLNTLPEEYVAGRLIANWDKVHKVIQSIWKEELSAQAKGTPVS